jgi:ABC-2 type transport system ATP-binding protein
MSHPVLALRELVVRYGSFTALHGVSAEFAGGALGLLGPNGAGKSSLLRAILGLVTPAAGTVTVFGEPARRSGALLRRRFGYMPERDSYIGGLSGVRGLAHLAEISGIPPEEAMMRAHDLLHFVGLGEERYRDVGTYSVGMRQRYKLAAALVHDPDILFLDEPTNGLDPQGRRRMLELIHRVRIEHGKHLILASHLLPDVERLCDQVWVLDRGRLVKSATLSELTAAARGAKRVRVAREQAAVFAGAARDSGFAVEPGRIDGEFVLARPESIVEPQDVFALARQSGCTVYAVRPAARSLEDAFLEALESNRGTDGGRD